ncbi:MAG: DUF5615 family PIN-like protein [Planctomycetota bacterium]
MRLLLDEGVHFKATGLLRDHGVQTEHVLEIGLRGEKDERILKEAIARRAVLVCFDSDFHKILAQSQAVKPTVIRIREDIVNPAIIAELLITTCQNMTDLIEAGAAISVDLESARGRKLPLK